MKAKIFTLLFCICTYASVQACPVCEKQQPKLLRGITHGAGPQSNWDWVIVSVMVLVTLLILFYAVKLFVKPEERNDEHIKQTILQPF